jgi:hypothetical protein
MATVLKRQFAVPKDAGTLSEELDEAMLALSVFDADRLEATMWRIHTMSAARLTSRREVLPEILEKHALFGQLLAVTAANLKVLGSVLHLASRMETQ